MAQEVLKPEIERVSEDGYLWSVYPQELTGLRMICLEDPTTGIVVTTTVANPDVRTAAHRAWAGARHSRASGDHWEIAHEMGQKGVDPDQKLDEMFSNYGHASVGDMARIEVDIVKNPMHFCLALFNEGVINSGQEKSTRYQSKFGKALLHGIGNYLPENVPQQEVDALEVGYQQLGELSLSLFAKHRPLLTEAFTDYFQPGEDKEKINSLNSRVLDCTRYFLLLGQGSGMSFGTSARDWARIISEMKASPIRLYGKVAWQIERLLTPTKEEEAALGYKAEAPSLLRHTESASRVNDNLQGLKRVAGLVGMLEKVDVNRQFKGVVEQGVILLDGKYTAGEKLAAQHLLTIWPGLNREQLLDWLHHQNDSVKKLISAETFYGHDNYHELPVFDGTTGLTVVFQAYLGEVRDFNRHRAFSRFAPLPQVFGLGWNYDTFRQVEATGFGLPLYLSEIDEFDSQGVKFEADLTYYYRQMNEFVGKVHLIYGDSIDYSFAINLLPLAHRLDLWMHGNPKQALYFTLQRTRNGGHINYRDLAYQANQLIAESDPYLSGLKLDQRPNPVDRKQFFDRS